MLKKILIVDDEPDTIAVLRDRLVYGRFEVSEAVSGEEALDMLEAGTVVPDLIFLDINLPGQDGLEILNRIKQRFTELPVIIMTAHVTTQNTIEAIKSGAHDYIQKPFSMKDVERLLGDLASRAQSGSESIHTVIPQDATLGHMVGVDPKIVDIYKTIGKAAPTALSVLILGESGTGKEVIARMIHHHSNRKDQPFIGINCAAIPEQLFESELFGHEKGAFTGAERSREGLFDRAAGGTLFLDEIGDMPLILQAKILRVLQEHEFMRVGGRTAIKTDVRIIAATGKKIEDLCAIGQFREDLLFRLNPVTIRVPPLRERRRDIPLLFDFFVMKYAQRMNKKVTGIPLDLLQQLVDFSWPGNIRQLENAVQQMMLSARDQIIRPSDMPRDVLDQIRGHQTTSDTPVAPPDEDIRDYTEARRLTMDRWECAFLRRALDRNDWNVTKTAREIGLHRSRVHELIARHELKR